MSVYVPVVYGFNFLTVKLHVQSFVVLGLRSFFWTKNISKPIQSHKSHMDTYGFLHADLFQEF